MAWADGRPRRWLERVGLARHAGWPARSRCSRAGLTVRLSRDGAGLRRRPGSCSAFVWAQAWAVYALLQAPDLFLGGVTLERLLELPAPALFAEPWRRTLAGAPARRRARRASSPRASRSASGSARSTPPGGGEIGHDPGLWAGLFGGGRAREPLAGRSVGAEPARPGRRGLRARAGRALAAPPRPHRGHRGRRRPHRVRRARRGPAPRRGRRAAGAAIAYPALVAAPAGALVLWLGRRVRRVTAAAALITPTLAACLAITGGVHVAVYLLNATLPLHVVALGGSKTQVGLLFSTSSDGVDGASPAGRRLGRPLRRPARDAARAWRFCSPRSSCCRSPRRPPRSSR